MDEGDNCRVTAVLAYCLAASYVYRLTGSLPGCNHHCLKYCRNLDAGAEEAGTLAYLDCGGCDLYRNVFAERVVPYHIAFLCIYHTCLLWIFGMEKSIKTVRMGRENCLRRIVVTGPESTGKTELSEALSLQLNAVLIPEYARSYVENLGRPYVYTDLEIIARYQMAEETRIVESAGNRILLMDTWLIITKVWFEVVFGSAPAWVEQYIKSASIDLFLVCKPDLPWIADAVRENGGEMRIKLFDRYCTEIEKFGFRYGIVEGFGEERLQNALKIIEFNGLD